ncbi:hypothetical protein LTR86_008608 [Recurvomyces mirabilis]|nr:hypothetical protein LTR86_008608 [Recurvomyces mirabilis]
MSRLNALSTRGWRILIIATCFLLAACFLSLSYTRTPRQEPLPKIVSPSRPASQVQASPAITLAPPIPCPGPRGVFVNDLHSQDIPHPAQLRNVTFPDTTTGSYDALGLKKNWLTISERYGPYGYGEDRASYNRTPVTWSKIDWGALQQQCLKANAERFNGVADSIIKPRFRLTGNAKSSHDAIFARPKTGRQAIVLRAWDEFEYRPEDLHNIRSTIVEASLATGSEYTVFLLVDVKAENASRLHEDDDVYRQVLDQIVPHEFQGMAVLFHETLQRSWYAKVDDFRANFQIMQPLQLFAHFYPEFDHFWQFEMDTRFTGNVGEMLQALDKFGVDQPYKQSRERASWSYIPRVHGTYDEFTKAINQTLDGGATVWGPLQQKVVEPVGLLPNKVDPKDDDFTFGVGYDADLVLLTPVGDVLRTEDGDWVYKYWYHGGVEKDDPRFLSVPAQARASWELLEAIHIAQHEDGVAVPSEATLPTFALWHGLKVVQAPMPLFQDPERDIHELNFVMNGGIPRDFHDGIANGPAAYKAHAVNFFTARTTFNWYSPLCNLVFEHWIYGSKAEDDLRPVPSDAMPAFMREINGKIYAPSFILHPRKTNDFIG